VSREKGRNRHPKTIREQTVMAVLSFLGEMLAKALPPIISAAVIAAGAVWFIAYQRALRMREALELLISCWRDYRDQPLTTSERFKADTQTGLDEIQCELERTDKAVLRLTVRFRRDLNAEISSLKSYVDTLTVGTTDEAMDTAAILFIADVTDPRTVKFYEILSKLAQFRDSVSWKTYLMGPWS
jgi:hypothetical protein